MFLDQGLQRFSLFLCAPLDKHSGYCTLLGHASSRLGRVGLGQVEASYAVRGGMTRGWCWVLGAHGWRWRGPRCCDIVLNKRLIFLAWVLRPSILVACSACLYHWNARR